MWPPELIAYAYIAEEFSAHSSPSQDHDFILKKALQEAYLEEADAPWLYLSLSRDDQKEIISEYGKQPFRLRFKDIIDKSSVFKKLEDAGYHPRNGEKENNEYGFSFPLKDSPGGYEIIIKKSGEIIKIRKLWNYSQYIDNKKENGHTAAGVILFYLPDSTKRHN